MVCAAVADEKLAVIVACPVAETTFRLSALVRVMLCKVPPLNICALFVELPVPPVSATLPATLTVCVPAVPFWLILAMFEPPAPVPPVTEMPPAPTSTVCDAVETVAVSMAAKFPVPVVPPPPVTEIVLAVTCCRPLPVWNIRAVLPLVPDEPPAVRVMPPPVTVTVCVAVVPVCSIVAVLVPPSPPRMVIPLAPTVMVCVPAVEIAPVFPLPLPAPVSTIPAAVIDCAPADVICALPALAVTLTKPLVFTVMLAPDSVPTALAAVTFRDAAVAERVPPLAVLTTLLAILMSPRGALSVRPAP